MVLRTCSSWGQARTEGGLCTQKDHRRLQLGPFPSSIRGALTWGFVRKSLHASFFDGSALIGKLPCASRPRGSLLPFGPAGSPSPVQQTTAQVAVVLAFSCHLPGGSWVPASRTGPRKERRASASCHSEQSDAPQDQTWVSPTAWYFTGSGLFLVAFKQEF